MKKNKGALSVALAIMLIVIISFSLVLSDFARIYAAKEKADRITDRAVDNVLCAYDKELKDEFRLFAVKENDAIKSAVQELLKENLRQDGTTLGVSNLTLKSVNVTLSQKLTDNDALKAAILKAHEKEALVSRLAQFIEKLDILKDFSKYSKIIDKYTEVTKKLFKIKKVYNRFSKTLRETKKLYDELKKVNFDDSLSSSNQFNSYQVVSYHTRPNNASKLVFISDVVGGQVEQIYQDNRVNENRENNEGNKNWQMLSEKLDMLRDYRDKITSLVGQLQSIAEKLSAVLQLASANMEYLEKLNIKNAKDVIKILAELSEKVEKYSNNVNKQIAKINAASEKIDEKITMLQEMLNDARTDDKREVSTSDFDMADIDIGDIDCLADLFNVEGIKPQFSLAKLSSFVYKFFTGELLSKRVDRGEVAQDVVTRLQGLSKQKRHSGRDKQNLSDESKLEESIDKFAELGEKSDFEITKSKQFYNKFIVADYVVSLFSYDDSKKFPESEAGKIKGAEVEYVLSGDVSAAKNIFYTDMKIFGIRFVLNSVAILAHKKTELNSLATTLSSWTGFLGYPVAYGVCVLVWSGAESYLDIKTLHQSGCVPILKKKADICFSLNLQSLQQLLNGNEFQSDYKVASDDVLTMDYSEFLLLFLLIEDEQETLTRIADLYQIRSGIDADKYSTVVTVEVVYGLKRLLPFAGSGISKASNGKGYEYKVKLVRGY